MKNPSKSNKSDLKKALLHERKKNAALEKEIKLLREENRIILMRKYGQKREKLPNDNEQFLPGLEHDEEAIVEEVPEEVEELVKTKTKRKRRSLADWTKHLPVIEKVIDLDEAHKHGLLEIGFDSYDRLSVTPAKYFIERTVIKKYVVEMHPNAGVITADRPKEAIAGSFFSSTFYADVLIKKYADHLPLYRQVEILFRNELLISRQTLSKMVLKLADVLNPLAELLRDTIINSKTVFLDETEVKLQAKGKCKKGYFWLLAGSDGISREHESDPPLVYYQFHDNRKHENVANLVGENFQGAFHSDAYKAYEQFAQKDGVEWQLCWAHARRNFFEATTGKEFRLEIIQLMDRLFVQEREYWQLHKNGSSDQDLLEFRTVNCKLIVDNIFSKINAFIKTGKYLPKEKIVTACHYINTRKKHFSSFLTNAKLRIDNNVSERKIRPVTIGRKNWMFVGSKRGGKAAATIYSLIQTCRNLGINPQEYLEDIFNRINNTPELELKNLLPQNWQK